MGKFKEIYKKHFKRMEIQLVCKEFVRSEKSNFRGKEERYPLVPGTITQMQNYRRNISD